MPVLADIVLRRLLGVIRERLAFEIVIGLQGPRSVGKSTLLQALAAEAGVGVIDLDDPSVRDAVASDPRTFVQGPSPVCIDECQHAPVVLDAIKAELNRGQRPGRFVITGSTRHDALPQAAQALTGRLHLLTVAPLSQGEIAGVEEDFVARCLEDPTALVSPDASTTTRDDYIERVVAGGFPMALQRPPGPARQRWFDDYVDQAITRDLLDLSKVRQGAKLPQLLQRLAGQTAQVLNVTAAALAVGLEQRTADNYTKLLEAVFLVQRIPAWGTTLTARAASAPKVHVVDSGVAARLLRLSPARLASLQPAALTDFGHLLETFVVGEILKQASWTDAVSGYGHWRTHDGDEADIVLERDDGAIVAFEVKAGSRVPGAGLSGLRKLRNALGALFIGGVVLYTGERSYTHEDRIHVMPIDQLWTPR
ncbi:ATP-binding protein [soil metagenome]